MDPQHTHDLQIRFARAAARTARSGACSEVDCSKDCKPRAGRFRPASPESSRALDAALTRRPCPPPPGAPAPQPGPGTAARPGLARLSPSCGRRPGIAPSRSGRAIRDPPAAILRPCGFCPAPAVLIPPPAGSANPRLRRYGVLRPGRRGRAVSAGPRETGPPSPPAAPLRGPGRA